jgi:hypothetical protein
MVVTIDQYIKMFNLRPADAIKMTKKYFGMLDHYVIYLGVFNNVHKFIANYAKGTKVLPDEEVVNMLEKLQPAAVEYFPGNEHQRPHAIERARMRNGEQAYNLFSNNCEHFKNWVHYGWDTSKQVEAFGATLIAGGILATAFGISKKDVTQSITGLFVALIGWIMYQKEAYPSTTHGLKFLNRDN